MTVPFANAFARRRVALVAILLCLGVALQLPAQTTQTTIQAPFWRVGAGFDSSLMINNAQPREIVAEVLVYGPFGQLIPAEPVRLAPLQSADVSLSDLLDGAEGYGYIALRYPGKAMEIAAQIVITHQTEGWIFNEGLLPRTHLNERRLEGVTFLGPLSPRTHVAVANITDESREVDLTARTAAGRRLKTVRLAPHQTALVSLSELTNAQRRADNSERSTGAFAVSVKHDGDSGDILMHGLVISKHGLGANMRFVAPNKLKSNRLLTPVVRPTPDHLPMLGLSNNRSIRSSKATIHSGEAASNP